MACSGARLLDQVPPEEFYYLAITLYLAVLQDVAFAWKDDDAELLLRLRKLCRQLESMNRRHATVLASVHEQQRDPHTQAIDRAGRIGIIAGYAVILRSLIGAFAVDQPRYPETIDEHSKTLGPEGFLERHYNLAAIGQVVEDTLGVSCALDMKRE